jgi:predicted negative regulator of RcsB-dependent stress response
MENTTLEEVVVPAPAPVQASVGVAPELVPHINTIAHLTGGNPIVAIILVAMLVLGGKTGWAFWEKRQKINADLEEKRLELEAKIKLAQIKADDDNEPKKVKRSKKA